MTETQIGECVDILRSRGGRSPVVHLVLGSGLGALVERVEEREMVPFRDLPGFPETSVEGHAGAMVVGRWGAVDVLVQAGRVHVYEGAPAGLVAGPVRVGRALGAHTLVLTNAAGGIGPGLAPGSLMVVVDHVNLMFRSPLAGPVLSGEARFPDMSRPYDGHLVCAAERAAIDAGLPLTRGVYGAVAGPQFETPAEVRALRGAGADVVGMSTVPEATVAVAAGQRVLAFSMITNRAAGLGPAVIDHEDVLSLGQVAGDQLGAVLERLMPELGQLPVCA